MHPPIFLRDTPESDEPHWHRESVVDLDMSLAACYCAFQNLPSALNDEADVSELRGLTFDLLLQAFNVAASARELIRLGHLFASSVLIRPIMERVAVSVLCGKDAKALQVWSRGWKIGERPTFPELCVRSGVGNPSNRTEAGEFAFTMASLVHASPESVYWNANEFENPDRGQCLIHTAGNGKQCDLICLCLCRLLSVADNTIHERFPEQRSRARASMQYYRLSSLWLARRKLITVPWDPSFDIGGEATDGP